MVLRGLWGWWEVGMVDNALGNDPNFATTITKKLAAITEQLNQEITNRTEADAQVCGRAVSIHPVHTILSKQRHQ